MKTFLIIIVTCVISVSATYVILNKKHQKEKLRIAENLFFTGKAAGIVTAGELLTKESGRISNDVLTDLLDKLIKEGRENIKKADVPINSFE